MTKYHGNQVNCQELACADENPHEHGDKCAAACPCRYK